MVGEIHFELERYFGKQLNFLSIDTLKIPVTFTTKILSQLPLATIVFRVTPIEGKALSHQ